MLKIRRLLRQPCVHALAFILFLFVSIWPVLSIPASSELPSFFAYLFSTWALMILTLFLLNRCLGDADADGSRDKPVQGGDLHV
jgi:hypothetical protein